MSGFETLSSNHDLAAPEINSSSIYPGLLIPQASVGVYTALDSGRNALFLLCGCPSFQTSYLKGIQPLSIPFPEHRTSPLLCLLSPMTSSELSTAEKLCQPAAEKLCLLVLTRRALEPTLRNKAALCGNLLQEQDKGVLKFLYQIVSYPLLSRSMITFSGR